MVKYLYTIKENKMKLIYSPLSFVMSDKKSKIICHYQFSRGPVKSVALCYTIINKVWNQLCNKKWKFFNYIN
jgi:hypothetical protein